MGVFVDFDYLKNEETPAEQRQETIDKDDQKPLSNVWSDGEYCRLFSRVNLLVLKIEALNQALGKASSELSEATADLHKHVEKRGFASRT